ncbi:Adhesin [Burkholderia multivorans]
MANGLFVSLNGATAIFALVAYLVADRALLHAHGHDASPLGCAQSAERVKYEALGRGFDDAAAGSQSEAFLSRCLVTGANEQT